MKSIFNIETENEIIERIKTLTPGNKALFGKNKCIPNGKTLHFM